MKFLECKKKKNKRKGKERKEERMKRYRVLRGGLDFSFFFLDHNEKKFKPDVVLVTFSS